MIVHSGQQTTHIFQHLSRWRERLLQDSGDPFFLISPSSTEATTIDLCAFEAKVLLYKNVQILEKVHNILMVTPPHYRSIGYYRS